MKQVLLRPRGTHAPPPRSDTLFGLIAWGVRMVHGKSAVEKLIEPMLGEPGRASLRITSAFPFEERADGPVYWFPRPRAPAMQGVPAFVEDRHLLAYVAGRPLADESIGSPQPSGWFFLAAGPFEHLLEGAVRFLERFGFGGGGTGNGGFDVDFRETEFLRLAEPGERGLLLSLHFPTLDERAAAAAATSGVAWGVERRAGWAGGRLGSGGSTKKRAVAMWTEGSVVPCAGSMGAAPVVGTDPGEGFPIVQHGFGFLVPVAGGAA